MCPRLLDATNRLRYDGRTPRSVSVFVQSLVSTERGVSGGWMDESEETEAEKIDRHERHVHLLWSQFSSAVRTLLPEDQRDDRVRLALDSLRRTWNANR